MVLAGCGAGDGPARSATVRDSAGIRIVENAVLDLPVWTLEEPHGPQESSFRVHRIVRP
jgi:hypothetical protein